MLNTNDTDYYGGMRSHSPNAYSANNYVNSYGGHSHAHYHMKPPKRGHRSKYDHKKRGHSNQSAAAGNGQGYPYGNIQGYNGYDDTAQYETHGKTTGGKKKKSKKYKGAGYDWIRKTLNRVDSQYGDEYLVNFEKHKVQDDRLGDLLPEDWKELIPAIGPRNDFKRLWRLKLQNSNYGAYGPSGEFDYDDETTTVPDSEMNGSEYTEQTQDDVNSELLSEPGSAFSNNLRTLY